MFWSEVFRALKENNFSLKIFYPATLSFKIDGGIKSPSIDGGIKSSTINRNKNQATTQKIQKGILHTENENKHNDKRTGSIKSQASTQ
jgi:hypothetical protein